MSDRNRNFSHRWFDEVWNKQNESHIDDFTHPEARSFGFPCADTALSMEGFKQAYREFNKTFSGIRVHVDEELIEGDNIACRWTASVTHTGEGLDFPATNKAVTFSGSSFMHLRDGKILEAWNFYDFTSAIRQLRG